MCPTKNEVLDLCYHCNFSCINGLNNPIVTWQGTHCELIKQIKRTNVSYLDLNIHKSKEAFVVTQDSKVNNKYRSMVLATNQRMTC